MNNLPEDGIHNNVCMFCMNSTKSTYHGHRDSLEFCDCFGVLEWRKAKERVNALQSVADRNYKKILLTKEKEVITRRMYYLDEQLGVIRWSEQNLP